MRVVVRSILTLLGSLFIASCATQPTFTTDPNWIRPICRPDFGPCMICRPDVVGVTTPWDDAVRWIYERLWSVARQDVDTKSVTVEVIDGSASLPPAGVCRVRLMRGDVFLFRMERIWISAEALRRAWAGPDPELTVARLIAHELDHAVLHHSMTPAALATSDPTLEEHEADQLGIYYFERAGYDCREWVKRGEGHPRGRLRAACNHAKEGRRPPWLSDRVRE